ncbi:MAG TPA: CBS domain-containing protein [Anaerolineales bacterium]|nr:CBS domain-containing protein [Anaerolineae bacterium]HIQ02182.1 CBS domain-containing protein [Anaerolineales bacterium]
MLVRDRMSPDPITVTPDTSVKETLELLRSRPFRHLPVVDEEGRLVGITTEKSLVYASPTSDLSLSVFEVDYLLSRMRVEQVMAREVITVSPDLPVEEAARVMIDHRIGCLPVVEEGKLVGIISDTDIFRVFVEGLGGGHPSLRVTVIIPERVGSLAQVVDCIAGIGGNIHSLGTFWGDRPEDRIIAFRVEQVDRDTLIQALQECDVQICHVWEPPAAW